MFTVVAQKNVGNAESYFDEHLSQNDYYAAGEIRPGQWIGAGAEKLGLKSEVTREQFHALCENRNPETKERLTQRQLKEGQRRVFYDFTCSAPKSVSVLAVTLADERLVTAHEEATRIAFRELETFAATRVRKQGNQKDRITGNLAAAAFTHTSSRALDPQLHTHFTVFNATFDEGHFIHQNRFVCKRATEPLRAKERAPYIVPSLCRQHLCATTGRATSVCLSAPHHSRQVQHPVRRHCD